MYRLARNEIKEYFFLRSIETLLWPRIFEISLHWIQFGYYPVRSHVYCANVLRCQASDLIYLMLSLCYALAPYQAESSGGILPPRLVKIWTPVNHWHMQKHSPKTFLSLARVGNVSVQSALSSSFCRMRWLGMFLLPLDELLVHRRSPSSTLPRVLLGYPHNFNSAHLHTWVERGTVSVKCLAQRHNATFQDLNPDLCFA